MMREGRGRRGRGRRSFGGTHTTRLVRCKPSTTLMRLSRVTAVGGPHSLISCIALGRGHRPKRGVGTGGRMSRAVPVVGVGGGKIDRSRAQRRPGIPSQGFFAAGVS